MIIIDKKLLSNRVFPFSYILCVLWLQLAPDSDGSHTVIGSYLVPVRSMQLLPLGTCANCITPGLLNSL